jgi:hypothetical protein
MARGKSVTCQSLERQLDEIWGEVKALHKGTQAGNLGPPGLVNIELELVRSRVEAAKASGDAVHLQRCLTATKLLLAKLKLLQRHHLFEEQSLQASAKRA